MYMEKAQFNMHMSPREAGGRGGVFKKKLNFGLRVYVT